MAGFDFDPFGDNDPLASIGRIPGLDSGQFGPGRRVRPGFRMPLDPETADSFGKQILNAGSSGLGHILGALDKPGQVVRGVLAGKGASALKHLVSFSDSMGLTTEKDHTTGRNLLDQWGITNKRDKGWGAWTAGLATDIATDPLTFVSGIGARHALTGTGRALQKAGHLQGWSRKAMLEGFEHTAPALQAAGKSAPEISHMVDQLKRIATPEAVAIGAESGKPLSGLVRIGIPFGPQKTLLTGAKSQAVAGAFDKLGGGLKYGTAAGRAWNGLFDPNVNGAKGALSQKGWATHAQPVLEAEKEAARLHTHGLLSDLDPVIREAMANGAPESFVTDAARAVAEQSVHGFDPSIVGKVTPAAQRINANQARYLAEAKKIGMPLSDAADVIQNVHRQALDVSHNALQLGGKGRNTLYPTVSGSNIGRDPLFTGLYGGTERVKELFNRFAGTLQKIDDRMAPGAVTAAKKANRQTVKSNTDAIHRSISQDFLDHQPGNLIRYSPSLQEAFAKQSKGLAKRTGFASEKYRTGGANGPGQGLPFFSPDLAADEVQRAAQHARTKSAAVGGIGTLADAAVRGGEIPLSQVLYKLGLRTTPHDIATGTPMQGALVELYRKLAPKGAGMIDPLHAVSTSVDPAAVARHGAMQTRAAKTTSRIADTATKLAAAQARAAAALPGSAAATKAQSDIAKLTSRAARLNALDMKRQGQVSALAQAVQDSVATGPRRAVKNLKREVNQWGVSKEHFAEILHQYNAWKLPEPVKPPIRALDSFTNAFKALAYPIWIPSHVRNAATASVNNATRGVGFRDYRDAAHLMTGRGTRDLSGISPAYDALPQADRAAAIRRDLFGSANIFGGHGLSNDIADNAAQALITGQGRFTPHVPGTMRTGTHGNLPMDTADLILKQGVLGSAVGSAKAAKDSILGLFDKSRRWGQGFNEHLGISGVGGVAKDVNPAVKAGRAAGMNIEDFFRAAQHIREMRTGATPAMAAREVNKLHFDYDALTQFEKNVMRRAFPFYTFMSRNLPLQFQRMVHQPGVFNAQYKPFFQQQGPDEKGYVPKYLNSGVAIPTGPEVDGKRQYISKLGLPAEEAFEKFHFKNGLPDVGATVLDFASSLNPAIKAPLEQLFDTQFHTQRKLSDLRAQGVAKGIGGLFGDDNPQLLSQILANSPATRFASSADKLLDSRKGWLPKAANLLTGVRVTDVDTDKQRAVELRGALEDILRGQPHLSKFTHYYPKPEDQANLTPEEVALLRLYTGIQDQGRAYAKEHRAKIGIKNP